MTDSLYHFDIKGLSSENVDTANAVIRGVSVITSGVTARGHNLEVDDKTLEQLHECAANMGTVPVKTDHKSGAASINGYLCNFRFDKKKLKADWHLLKTHPQCSHVLEMAERMPNNFGLSAAFMGKEETKGTKKFARCTELVSVDLVAQPAANPDGLFESRVDKARDDMADTPTTEEKLLAAIEAQGKQVTELAQHIAGIQQFNAHLVELMESEDEDEDEDEGEGEDEDEDEGEDDGKEMSSVADALNYLEAKTRHSLENEKNKATEFAFEEVRDKIVALAARIEELEAENEALQLAANQGNGGNVSASTETKVRMFESGVGGKTEFEARVTELCASGKGRGEAILLAQKENKALYLEHLRSIGAIA